MKIIYIVSGTGMSGGATKSFLLMMEGALNAGHTCYVICPNKGELYEYLRLRNIPVFSLKYLFNANNISNSIFAKLINWVKWQRRKILNIRAAKQLTTICNTINPDIIHSNSSIINIGCIVSKKLGIPHVVHLREYGDLDFNYKIHGLQEYIKKGNAYFVAITNSIFKYRKLSSLNASVIYNGICREKEIRFSRIKDPYILFAGRIQETKGIRDLVSAYVIYAKKSRNPLKLKIAGDYNFHEGEKLKMELNHILKKYDFKDNVEWLGVRTDIEDLMYKSTVTIVPSKNEGFGRVMPEAIANGCLVIGYNKAGTKEQMENGLKLTGREIALSYHDVEELADQILKVDVKGIETFYPMIETAQMVLREMYTVEGYQQKIINVYNKISNKNYDGL